MRVIITIAAMVLVTIFYAVVLESHWVWFVQPLGAPDISLAHAYGLVLLIKLSITRLDVHTKDQAPFEIVAGSLIVCVMYLALGKIVHLMMVG